MLDWKECVTVRAIQIGDHLERLRWPTGNDFNCDPAQFTISDLSGGFAWLWTWPGDWLINQIMDKPEVARFFEWDGTPFAGTILSWLVTPLLGFMALAVLVGALDSFQKALPPSKKH